MPTPTLTDDETAEGRQLEAAVLATRQAIEQLRAVELRQVADRNAWIGRMDRRYGSPYNRLPSLLARVLGVSRWTVMDAVRADRREREAEAS